MLKKRMISFLRPGVVIVFASLLPQNCTTLRVLTSENEAQNINRQLRKKDINKSITVFFKSSGSQEGTLLAFDHQHLTLFTRDSASKMEIPLEIIERIEIKENKYWPLVLAAVAGAGVALYFVADSIAEGYESIGH